MRVHVAYRGGQRHPERGTGVFCGYLLVRPLGPMARALEKVLLQAKSQDS